MNMSDEHRLVLAALADPAANVPHGQPVSGRDLPCGEEIAEGVYPELVARGLIYGDDALAGPKHFALTPAGRLEARQAQQWRDGSYRNGEAELAVLRYVCRDIPLPTRYSPAEIDAAYARLGARRPCQHQPRSVRSHLGGMALSRSRSGH
jgi:hypothetical protein